MARKKSENPNENIYPVQTRINKNLKERWDLLPQKIRNARHRKLVQDLIVDMESSKYEWQDKLLS